MDTHSVIDVATLVIAFASLIAAVAAAVSTSRQAHAAALSNTAVLFLAFSDRIASAEMNRAFVDLIEWRRKNGDDFVRNWIHEFERRTAVGLRINDCRRLVGRYFSDLQRAREAEIIDEKLVTLASGSRGFSVYYWICIPMTAFLHNEQNWEAERERTFLLLTNEQLPAPVEPTWDSRFGSAEEALAHGSLVQAAS